MAESAAAVPGEASPPLRELKAAILMLVETLKAHDAHLVEQAARQEVQQRQLQRHSHPGRSDGEKPTADWSHRFTRLTPPGLRRRPAYIVRYGIAVHVYAKEAGRVSSQAGGAADGAGRSGNPCIHTIMSSQRARGIAIALVGVLAVSPDAMLLRWMRSLGASSPDVATAKYAGIIACMILIGYHHGLRSPNQSMPHFLASAFSQLLYQLAFTFCLLLTDAAKALLLISLAPLWAALFGYFALGEKLPRRTLIALGVCMCGVLLVFAPRLLGVSGDADGSADDNDEGDAVAFAIPYSQLLSKDVPIPRVYDSLAGDSLAIATGIAQGLSLTVSRHAAIHKPGCELTLATALSSLVAAMVAMELPCYDISVQQASAEATFWACTPPVWRTPSFVLLALCDALAVATFYASMLLAPKYITGGEVALVMLLEVILGPLWVHVRFGDVPSLWTVAGGAVLLSTLALHECHAQRHGCSPSKACSSPASPKARRWIGDTKKRGQEVESQDEPDERPYHSFEAPGAPTVAPATTRATSGCVCI